MSAEARYFRVGSFVLGGFALIAVAVVILGGQSLLEEPLVLETYFDESVQGLEIGSPVKARGVRLGRVSEIGMVQDYYALPTVEERLEHGQKILVRMELSIEPRDPEADVETQARENLKLMIEKGFRLRLTSSGLTGTSFIEADYASPKPDPPMEIAWTPKHVYLPSTTSTLKTLSTAAERIFERLEDADIGKVLEDLDHLLVSLTRKVEELDTGEIQREVVGLVDELRGTNARVQRSVDGSKYDFQMALENLRVASENLRDLSETAREYPSLMLLGEPPAPSKVSER
jgi:ABC-type transporter Mla subunit MlaD